MIIITGIKIMNLQNGIVTVSIMYIHANSGISEAWQRKLMTL